MRGWKLELLGANGLRVHACRQYRRRGMRLLWPPHAALHCRPDLGNLGLHCHAAVHRYCWSEGYESGFGPVESQVAEDIAWVTCVFE